MGKNTKMPRMSKPPPSGAAKQDEGWRKNSQDEVNKHIYDLMVASKRNRQGIDKFKEENKQEVDAVFGLEGTEENLVEYRRQLDADRKAALKGANKARKESDKADAKRKRELYESDADDDDNDDDKKKKKKKKKKDRKDSDDNDDSDDEKKKKKKKKKSRRDSSDSDSDSESDSDKKKKKKRKSRKDSGSDSDSDSDSERKKKKKKKKSRKDSGSDSEDSKSKKKDKDKKKNKKRDKDKKKKKDKDKKKSKDKDEKPPPKPPVVVDKVREAPGTIVCVLRNNFGMVEKKILKTGHGRKPERGNQVKMHYNMYLESGMKKIYSTKDKYQKQYELIVGCDHVMKGWDEGVMSMRLGEQARLTISGKFGYGMNGNAELGVPSMADLVLDIEINEIGEDVTLPTPEEIAKRKIAQKTVFIDRSGDRMGDSLKFRSAPF